MESFEYLDKSFGENTTQESINFKINLLKKWVTVSECRQKFLKNSLDDLNKVNHLINPEVIKSWLRSKDFGVNPEAVVVYPQLTADRLTEIIEQKLELVNITKDVSKAFESIFLMCGYVFYLLDEEGLILLQTGEWQDTNPALERKMRSGIIADEASEGTTSHDLCLRLSQPIQLIGPEHYCEAFQNVIASSVPLKEKKGGKAFAAMALLKPLAEHNRLQESTLKEICCHSWGLLNSIAMTVLTQYELKQKEAAFNEVNKKTIIYSKDLQKSRQELHLMQRTVDNALELAEDGIITVDPKGRIINANEEGKRLLKLKTEELGGKHNISEFIVHDPPLVDLAKKKNKTTVSGYLKQDGEKKLYQIDISPIMDSSSNQQLKIIFLKLSPLFKSQNVAYESDSENSFSRIIGDSQQIRKAIELSECFSKTQENILLLGESGTGKELFARAIHEFSRPKGPFVAVNCAAMPRSLIESELFGYEGGSFTGAQRSGRPGKIELAEGGTLFLDEIGDMPFGLQSVLLRVIEDKKIMRIGGQQYKKVDFRLITATNKDLAALVKEGKFREDLFFRLSVLYIQIPPLRDRQNDVEILSYFFLQEYCQKLGIKAPKFSIKAMEKIKNYKWPGNVRELQNAIIYAVNSAKDGIIELEDLPEHILAESCLSSNEDNENLVLDTLCLEKLEKNAIRQALLRANNYVPNAAKLLGISRATLYRKLKDLEKDESFHIS